MKCVKTDGRPWYKQAASGLMIAVASVIAAPFLFLFFVGLYGVVMTAIQHWKVSLALILFLALSLAGIFLVVFAWCWAKEEL